MLETRDLMSIYFFYSTIFNSVHNKTVNHNPDMNLLQCLNIATHYTHQYHYQKSNDLIRMQVCHHPPEKEEAITIFFGIIRRCLPLSCVLYLAIQYMSSSSTRDNVLFGPPVIDQSSRLRAGGNRLYKNGSHRSNNGRWRRRRMRRTCLNANHEYDLRRDCGSSTTATGAVVGGALIVSFALAHNCYDMALIEHRNPD